MKSLINLKAFLAVLLILIVSAALLVAYFRNYTTEPTGHEHGDHGHGAAAGGEKSEMAGSREVQEAEQQLWQLTAADQPDGAKTEATIREIAKLRTDQRLGFIQAVAQAAQVLTKIQRQALLGDARKGTRQ